MNENLKMALLRSQRAQYEVAAQAGVSETRLSRIALGRAKPTEEEETRIAEVLGVSRQTLFGAGEKVSETEDGS